MRMRGGSTGREDLQAEERREQERRYRRREQKRQENSKGAVWEKEGRAKDEEKGGRRERNME
jgi:hypothetical protein